MIFNIWVEKSMFFFCFLKLRSSFFRIFVFFGLSLFIVLLRMRILGLWRRVEIIEIFCFVLKLSVFISFLRKEFILKVLESFLIFFLSFFLGICFMFLMNEKNFIGVRFL